MYPFLLQQVSGRSRALDLGCGPGKISMVLAEHFAEVVALDPSQVMIDTGRAADNARHSNITWTTASAEDYNSDSRFDLVVAGTSIHWLDHAIMFPKLSVWTNTVAIVTGDAPEPAPCGDEAWLQFIGRWMNRLGRKFDHGAYVRELNRHELWMDIAGRESFTCKFYQSVPDFITCQHSRATWSRATMGPSLSAEFDTELDALVRPFSSAGQLELQMKTQLTWGDPRRTQRA
jgi:SAM-dependent methyltransferase